MSGEAIDATVLALFCAPLIAAAAWDAWSFRIPNWLTGAFVVAFLAAAALSPVPVDWLGRLAAGVLVLVVGVGLFALRIFGGGDVKLMAGAALWLGFAGLPGYLMWMGALGGVLTLALIAARAAAPKLVAEPARLPRLLTPRQGVPYGIAIAGAGLATAPDLSLLAGFL